MSSLSAGASYSWRIDRRWHAAPLAVLRCGVRWGQAHTAKLAHIRRNLLGASNRELKGVLEALLDPSVWAPEIVRELTRIPAMRKRMLEMGLIKPEAKLPSERAPRRREVGRLTARFDRERLPAGAAACSGPGESDRIGSFPLTDPDSNLTYLAGVGRPAELAVIASARPPSQPELEFAA